MLERVLDSAQTRSWLSRCGTLPRGEQGCAPRGRPGRPGERFVATEGGANQPGLCPAVDSPTLRWGSGWDALRVCGFAGESSQQGGQGPVLVDRQPLQRAGVGSLGARPRLGEQFTSGDGDVDEDRTAIVGVV